MNIKIIPIPAFQDNYIWAIINHDTQKLCVVDPGDAQPVLDFMDTHQLQLDTILITHHHHDHTGGVTSLANQFHPRIYGPNNPSINNIDTRLTDGSMIRLDTFNLDFQVLAVPGHTLDHIAYYSPGILFCGDTLFSAGCGRVFEGTYEQMLNSLDLLADLPDETLVYCAHEYTLANLTFSQAVESNNKFISKHISDVKILRKNNHPSLPSKLNLEKKVNPFLRVREPTVKISAEQHVGSTLNTPVDVFTAIREWKNSF